MNSRAGRAEIARFFSGRRCLFWFAGLLSALTLMLSDPCNSHKYSDTLATAFFTAMVMACFWEAHVTAIGLDLPSHRALLWQICKYALGTLLALLLAGLAGSVVAMLFVPTYQCYTDRARVSEMLALASDLKTSITERISKTNTLEKAGSGLQVKAQDRVVGGFVTDSGTIVLISENPPAVVTMTPQIVDGKTGESKWTCLGYPQKLMPMMCREELAR